jgi:hypothetical protein
MPTHEIGDKLFPSVRLSMVFGASESLPHYRWGRRYPKSVKQICVAIVPGVSGRVEGEPTDGIISSSFSGATLHPL